MILESNNFNFSVGIKRPEKENERLAGKNNLSILEASTLGR
jgi:hypothetical protein